VTTELLAFEDGAKLKRPRTLHPHLPFVVVCEAGAQDIDDTARFLVKSPLASASPVPKESVSPFWAVLQEQREGDANMEVTRAAMKSASTGFSLGGEDDEPRKRGPKAVKPTPLVMEVPAFRNTKVVTRGEVLVFSGSLLLQEASAEE